MFHRVAVILIISYYSSLFLFLYIPRVFLHRFAVFYFILFNVPSMLAFLFISISLFQRNTIFPASRLFHSSFSLPPPPPLLLLVASPPTAPHLFTGNLHKVLTHCRYNSPPRQVTPQSSSRKVTSEERRKTHKLSQWHRVFLRQPNTHTHTHTHTYTTTTTTTNKNTTSKTYTPHQFHRRAHTPPASPPPPKTALSRISLVSNPETTPIRQHPGPTPAQRHVPGYKSA